MSVAIDYTSGAFAATKAQSVGTITGSDVDLSSGQYFEYTPAADTTFTFSNAPASGTAAGFALAVTGANVTSGYDLANASYDSVSFSVSAQSTQPTDLFISPDGYKIYISSNSNDIIFEYDLSTAFDLSTASYNSVNFLLPTANSDVTSLSFSSDGLKFYTADFADDTIYEYDLTSAWDLSTASYNSVSLSVVAAGNDPQGVVISTDGYKMFVLSLANDTVYQYSLSTAFDLSSASYDSVSFAVGSQDTTPSNIWFSPEGSTMFLSGNSTDSIYKYSLTSAWDLSTASYSGESFSVSSQETNPKGVTFSSDGAKMYVVGNATDTIYQYSTAAAAPAPATFTYPTSVEWPSGTAPDAPAVGETDVLVFYTEDGGTTYYGFQAGDAMA